MGMSQAEADDFEKICKTIIKGLGDVSAKLQRRIGHLEAENRELRRLWNECEKDCVEMKSRVNEIEIKLSKVKDEL